MKLKAMVAIQGKAKLTCTCPTYWECLEEDEKINYFLEHCNMVVDLVDLMMDDTFFSAQDIEEDADKIVEEEIVH